jgi:hypothetical protein
MIRRLFLVVVAATLVSTSAAAQQGRARRVESQPAAAVRTARVDVATAPAAFTSIPFAPGERLFYDVSWNSNATAATVVLQVGDRGKYFGKEALPISADVETVGLVKFLASVDLAFKSYSDPKTLLPIRAESSMTINGKAEKGDVVFDRTKKVAVAGQRTTPIGPETGDLLGLFYRLRAMKLAEGDEVVLDSFDGRNRAQVKVVVEGKEQLDTALGARKAQRIAFIPIENGAPNDANKIRVWYTDDAARVPVLVTATPKFGAIRMAIKNGANARR